MDLNANYGIDSQEKISHEPFSPKKRKVSENEQRFPLVPGSPIKEPAASGNASKISKKVLFPIQSKPSITRINAVGLRAVIGVPMSTCGSESLALVLSSYGDQVDPKSKLLDIKNVLDTRLMLKDPLNEIEIKTLFRSLSSMDTRYLFETNFAGGFESILTLYRLNDLVNWFEAFPIREIKKCTAGEGRGGVNGSYFLCNTFGEPEWVFKPQDEEASDLMLGVCAGEGAKREHLASALNREGFYPIPLTLFVSLNGQVGSLQHYIKSSKTLHEIMTSEHSSDLVRVIGKDAIHASLIFDMRFNNWDRHLGNLLFGEGNTYMIDHGACMTTSRDDPPKMEQLSLPQSHEGWGQKSLDYLQCLDSRIIARDAAIMKEHGVGQRAIDRMINGTILLVRSVIQASEDKGIELFSPYDIGFFFLREYSRVWEGDLESSLAFFREVIAEKRKFSVGMSKVAIIKARRAYEKQQTNPRLVELLYGVEIGSDAGPDQIDWGHSILGKYVEREA